MINPLSLEDKYRLAKAYLSYYLAKRKAVELKRIGAWRTISLRKRLEHSTPAQIEESLQRRTTDAHRRNLEHLVQKSLGQLGEKVIAKCYYHRIKATFENQDRISQLMYAQQLKYSNLPINFVAEHFSQDTCFQAETNYSEYSPPEVMEQDYQRVEAELTKIKNTLVLFGKLWVILKKEPVNDIYYGRPKKSLHLHYREPLTIESVLAFTKAEWKTLPGAR